MSQEIKIAIIAALSAAIGAVVSQSMTFFLSWLDKRHQKKVLLREKYEEMALLYVDSLDWFQSAGSSTNFEQLQAFSFPKKARQVQVLCSVYFPELLDYINEYVGACNAYYKSILEGFDHTINVNAMIQAQTKEKHVQLMPKISAAREGFDEAIKKYSSKYIKA